MKNQINSFEMAVEIMDLFGQVPLCVEDKYHSLSEMLAGKMSLKKIETLVREWVEETKLLSANTFIIKKAENEWKGFLEKNSDDNADELVEKLEIILKQLIRDKFDGRFFQKFPSPKYWITELNKVYFGNDKAKETLVTSLYFHKLNVEGIKSGREMSSGLRQPPLLIAGGTGTGKTYLCSEACELIELDFISIDASRLVPEGIVGMTISDIGRALYKAVDEDLDRAAQGIVYLDEFDKLLDSAHGNHLLTQLLTILDGTSPLCFNENATSRISTSLEIPTKNILFVLSGSFSLDEKYQSEKKVPIGFYSTTDTSADRNTAHFLLNTSIPSELAGRISQVIEIDPPNHDQLLSIIEHSVRSPLTRVRERLALFGSSLVVEEAFKQQITRDELVQTYGVRGAYIALERAINQAGIEMMAPEKIGGVFCLG